MRDPGSASESRTIPRRLSSREGEVRLLLGTELVFNTAFYMVMPYLAAHLAAERVSATWVGVVLGARTLAQQGLYVVGGLVGDRRGYRNAIICGCFVRTAGFAWLAWAESVPGFVGASAVIGLASAIFAPAQKAYLAQLSPDLGEASFARAASWSQAGGLLGPLIGAALIAAADLRVSAWIAAVTFAVWACVLGRRLPSSSGAVAPQTQRGWLDSLRDRRLMVLSAALSGYAILFAQMYVSLPVALGGAFGTGATFALSSALVVLGQRRVTAWCERRISRRAALVGGLATMGAAFLLPALACTSWREGMLGFASTCAAVVLTIGMMIAFPASMSAVAALSPPGRLASYFGTYYLYGGMASAAGSAIAGYGLEHVGFDSPRVWLLLAAVGLASAVAIARVDVREPEL